MSLTHPSPFAWKSNPPMPELAGFLRELSAKSPPKPMKAGAVHQPPAFRKPSRLKVARPKTKAQILRELLSEHGPLTSIELAALSMLPAKQVPAYLKWDMGGGRIACDRSTVPCRYALVEVAA